MRDLNCLEKYRLPDRVIQGRIFSNVFEVKSPVDGKSLRIRATTDGGWDHLSISRANRCPRWDEMEFIKRLFFTDEEVAMQLHVAPVNHVSIHPYCLHLWRPNDGREIPLPPLTML